MYKVNMKASLPDQSFVAEYRLDAIVQEGYEPGTLPIDLPKVYD